MPVLVDFTLGKYEDGVLTVALAPPVAIGGWEIHFALNKRFGGESDYAHRSVSSGFNGTSGITVTSSGTGVFNVGINSVDTSGLEYGAYAARIYRSNSGHYTNLTEGYLTLTP